VLVVVVVLASARGIRSGQLAVPLVFGLLVLIQSLVYERFYDRFLIAVLPTALLAAALCVHRNLLAYRSALLGALVLAGWSIWWERDYMGRQGAIWQVCRTVVELGIPADQVDCGFEWNGWYRGEQTMTEAVALAPTRSGADRLSDAILARLSPPSILAHWRMDFVLRETPCPDRVLAVATYGNGNRVYGLERC